VLVFADLAVLIVTGIVFFRWLYRAHRNATELGAEGLRCGPRMAVGVWFIPILNLWRPKHVLDDLWRSSDPGDDAASSNLVVLWWAAFLLSGIVTRIAMQVSVSTLDGVRTQNTLDLVAYGLSAAAAVGAVLLVRRITGRQERHAEQLRQG
jgi:hypothetical protein